MRKLWLLPIALALGGCLGHSSSGNELTGQVKRVQHCGDLLLPECPLLCPAYVHVDISLGTMRYGVWSSTQDIWLWVKNEAVIGTLEKAVQNGSVVKVNYDVARGRWFDCVEKEELTSVEVVQ